MNKKKQTNFILRKVLIFIIGIAVNTMNGCKMIGMPECDVLLAQCTIYLARAPKSRLMEDALRAAQRIVANHKGPQPGVPLHLRNAQTKTLKNLGNSNFCFIYL